MNKEIKVLRLKTGEDIIAKVTCIKNLDNSIKYKLEDPLVLLVNYDHDGKAKILFMEFIPFANIDNLEFSQDVIYWILNPITNVSKYYSQYTSKIITPTTTQTLLTP